MATLNVHGPIEGWSLVEGADGTVKLRLRVEETHIIQEFAVDAETAENLAADLTEHVVD